jgi:hypothetical protein
MCGHESTGTTGYGTERSKITRVRRDVQGGEGEGLGFVWTPIDHAGYQHKHSLSHLFKSATVGSVNNSGQFQSSFLCVSLCPTFFSPMCVCVCDAAVRLRFTVDETVSTRKCPAPTITGPRAHSWI